MIILNGCLKCLVVSFGHWQSFLPVHYACIGYLEFKMDQKDLETLARIEAKIDALLDYLDAANARNAQARAKLESMMEKN